MVQPDLMWLTECVALFTNGFWLESLSEQCDAPDTGDPLWLVSMSTT